MFELCVLFFVLFLKETTTAHCVCVPFWECSDDTTSNEEVLNILDFRDGCAGYFDVCCKIKCGQRKTDNLPFADMITNRILGKDNGANFAEFPWMLGVLLDDTYRCGASLIHPKVAMTAAHCVYASGVYKIRAGEWNWKNSKEPLKHQDRLAKKIIIHPLFNPNSLINDIALIILNRPVQLAEHIQTACLPHHNSDVTTSECVATGWGRTSHRSERNHEPILNKVSLPIVEINKCVQALQRARFGSLFNLHQSFICAGGESNKDTCKGDGGSPLVCLIDGESDRYQQVGIVSWGLSCGLGNTPGVYVNVARFINWIDEKMKHHNLDHKFYKF